MSAGDISIHIDHLCLAPPESKRATLRLDDVSAGYDSVLALSHATATAAPGTFVALVGPNGAGKSTLLKAIVGAIRAWEGKIAIGDATTVSDRRRLIAYVSQHESIEWGYPISALEVVELGQLGQNPWIPWTERTVRDRALGALAALGMADFKDRSIGALSGGQQQRIIMARALMQDAPLFLLDEPLSGVDPRSAEVILGLLRRLVGEGHTVLMATHDVEEAASVADRVWGVNGSVVADVPAADLLKPEVMRSIYGGHLVMLADGGVALGDQQR